MLLSTPLALAAYVLLLTCTLGSLIVSLRTLRANDRLQVKIDWLRSALVTRDSTIRSYETGHFVGEPADEQATRELPPRVPLPPPRKPSKR